MKYENWMCKKCIARNGSSHDEPCKSCIQVNCRFKYDPKICEHKWVEIESQCERDVVCVNCGMPGEKNLETGNIFYPAT